MELVHHYDSNGLHRIVRLDNFGFLWQAGQWVGYDRLAMLIDGHRKFIVAANGYGGTALKPDVIYEISIHPAQHSEYSDHHAPSRNASKEDK